MALFPRFVNSELGSLFRVFDELTAVARHPAFAQQTQVFAPRFSLKESEEGYELQGELPGVSQQDINLEFTDSQTLSIRGRTESHREEGKRPEQVAAAEATPAVEAASEQQAAASETSSYHKPSVEDEFEVVESVADTTDAPAETPAEGSVAAAETKEAVEQPEQKERYWFSERSVGEFARTFNFPSRIDQENVKASLKDGILSVLVPKAAPHVKKQINIE